jgi:HAD superfamily hydrolase (TIGR01548 family)
LAAHVAAISATRTGFVQGLQRLGVTTGPQHANFVVARFGAQAGDLVQALADEGILVRDRSHIHPSLSGWVRIAIGTPPQMARCLAAVRKQVAPRPQLHALLFDMDGPLVDVSASYRQAIVETARWFLRQHGAAESVVAAVGPQQVEALKRRGGLNNDWDCTHTLLAEHGCAVPYADVVAEFQRRYWGEAGEGLIAGEPFRVGAPLRDRIGQRYATAILTGRPRQEALWTLRMCGADALWPAERVVAMEDGPAKPAPDGLVRLASVLQVDAARCAYLGDSVDDMRAAVAAGMLAIGVLPAGCGWNDGLVERLAEAGAWAVFASVEEVMTWLQD